MKRILLASALSFAAGISAVHAYWWLQALRFDAERTRMMDEDFDGLADLFYADEAADAEYNTDEDD
jgi:hypothetical protein